MPASSFPLQRSWIESNAAVVLHRVYDIMYRWRKACPAPMPVGRGWIDMIVYAFAVRPQYPPVPAARSAACL